MSQPTAFDLDYRRIVLPRLSRLICAYAYHVQLGVDGYNDAFQAIMNYARKYGAAHLSPDLLDELVEWIQCQLLAHIDDQPRPGVLTGEEFMHIFGDP